MRGFSVIELMVALAISLFLLIGLFTIMQGTRRTSDNERVLAQFQDDERIAMTLMGGVIESAGYYSNALNIDVATALPASPVFASAGQGVFGATNAQGDTLTLRYQTSAADGVLNCQGTNPGAGTYENEFSVDNNGQLVCKVNGGNAVPLVGNIQTLNILYGVGTAVTTPNSAGTVDAYLTAAQVNAAAIYWTNVYTVKLSITFKNPLAGQPGQPATVSFSRVIALKSRTGLNI
jgi:type IV pilus assembly protein PilW